MFSLVLTIIAFAGAMGVPAFLTAIVESAASKIRPPSSRASASRSWTDRAWPVAMLLSRNGTQRAMGSHQDLVWSKNLLGGAAVAWPLGARAGTRRV